MVAEKQYKSKASRDFPPNPMIDGDVLTPAAQAAYSAAHTHLGLLDDPDGEFIFQTYADFAEADVDTKIRLAKTRRGRLRDMFPELWQLNGQGAAVAVTINATSGDRLKASVKRARACWAEVDVKMTAPLPASFFTVPFSFVVRSSRDADGASKFHYYWGLDGHLDLELWEEVQAAIAAVPNGAGPIGDRNAIHRNQVLRLAGFQHQKHPRHTSTTEIVAGVGTGERVPAAKMLAGFPKARTTKPAKANGAKRPSNAKPKRESPKPALVCGPPRRADASASRADIGNLARALAMLDEAQVKNAGEGMVVSGQDGDADLSVDIRAFDWWWIAGCCIHFASRGDQRGYALWSAVSGGGEFTVPDTGEVVSFIGAPQKFNEPHQIATWDRFESDPSLGGGQPGVDQRSPRTIFYAAQRLAGYSANRPGRRWGLPKVRAASPTVRPVEEAAAATRKVEWHDYKIALSEAFVEVFDAPRSASLIWRIMNALIGQLDDAEDRIGQIDYGRLAGEVDSSKRTVREYVRRLVNSGFGVKSQGNATSRTGRRGIDFSLMIPKPYRDRINRPDDVPIDIVNTDRIKTVSAIKPNELNTSSATVVGTLASSYGLGERRGGEDAFGLSRPYVVDVRSFFELMRDLGCLSSDEVTKIRQGAVDGAEANVIRRELGEVVLEMLCRDVPPCRMKAWTTEFIGEWAERKAKADARAGRSREEYRLHWMSEQKFVHGLTAFLHKQMGYVQQKFPHRRHPRRVGRDFILEIAGEQTLLQGVGTAEQLATIEGGEAELRQERQRAVQARNQESARRGAETRKRNRAARYG